MTLKHRKRPPTPAGDVSVDPTFTLVGDHIPRHRDAQGRAGVWQRLPDHPRPVAEEVQALAAHGAST